MTIVGCRDRPRQRLALSVHGRASSAARRSCFSTSVVSMVIGVPASDGGVCARPPHAARSRSARSSARAAVRQGRSAGSSSSSSSRPPATTSAVIGWVLYYAIGAGGAGDGHPRSTRRPMLPPDTVSSLQIVAAADGLHGGRDARVRVVALRKGCGRASSARARIIIPAMLSSSWSC